MLWFERIVALLLALLAGTLVPSTFAFAPFKAPGYGVLLLFLLLISSIREFGTDVSLVCPSFAHAEDAAVSASTFYLAETETQFSVNIANDSSDVFIYFTSPAYSWVGVGFGEGMANSFMLIMYPSKDGNSTHPPTLEHNPFTQ